MHEPRPVPVSRLCRGLAVVQLRRLHAGAVWDGGTRGSWRCRRGAPHTHRVASHIRNLFPRCWGQTSKCQRGPDHAAPGGRRGRPSPSPRLPGFAGDPWRPRLVAGSVQALSSLSPGHLPVCVFCVEVNFRGHCSAQVRTTPGVLGCTGLFGSSPYGVGVHAASSPCLVSWPRETAHSPTRLRLCLGRAHPMSALPSQLPVKMGRSRLGVLLAAQDLAFLRGLRSARTSPSPWRLLGSAEPRRRPVCARTISQTRGAGAGRPLSGSA